MTKAILQVSNLVKRYGSVTALDGVTFSVDTGEMFGLLGPNGAGKTTLLSIVTGLLPATSGEVRLLGRSALPMDDDLRCALGLVPQELAIYGELTARENLYFFGSLYGLAGSTLRERVDEVLAAVGLTERADDRVETFSGGMKRRLNLGAALVHRPAIVFLDEPTTGVDPQSRNHIFEEIRRINQTGTTIIYTSHYMEEVQALCPRVGILDHGRLIICDTVAALLQRMTGVIRIRVPALTADLRQRIEQIPGVELAVPDGNTLTVDCQDVKGTLLRLVALLNEMQVELSSLETQEPNLERVFLHLTGRGLRD